MEKIYSLLTGQEGKLNSKWWGGGLRLMYGGMPSGDSFCLNIIQPDGSAGMYASTVYYPRDIKIINVLVTKMEVVEVTPTLLKLKPVP